MKNSLSLLLLLLAICFFNSCAGGSGRAGGLTYTDVKPAGRVRPNPGEGIVLIYRKGSAGSAKDAYLFANDRLLTSQLSRGTFYCLDAPPGPLKVAYSWRQHEQLTQADALGEGLSFLSEPSMHRRHGINLNILAGATYFLHMDGKSLKLVSPEEGEEQIATCILLDPSPNSLD